MSKQFGIKEVLNCAFYDYTTGAELFYADYMSDSSIETTAERLDLRGGQGNYKLLSFDHTKSMTFKGEMPLVDLNTIAMLTGKALNIGAVTVPKREVLTTAGATPTISLASTPVAISKVYIISNRDVGTEQTAGTPASTQNTYSLSDATLTLNATSCPAGTTIAVSYTYTTAATVSQSTFTADKFAGYVRICGTGVITDQITGANVYTIFDIKKAKAKNNFTITQKSTDATKLELEFDLYSVDVGADKVYVTMTALT